MSSQRTQELSMSRSDDVEFVHISQHMLGVDHDENDEWSSQTWITYQNGTWKNLETLKSQKTLNDFTIFSVTLIATCFTDFITLNLWYWQFFIFQLVVHYHRVSNVRRLVYAALSWRTWLVLFTVERDAVLRLSTFYFTISVPNPNRRCLLKSFSFKRKKNIL